MSCHGKKKSYTQFASSMRRVMGVQRACHGGEKKICLNLMAGTSYGKKNQNLVAECHVMAKKTLHPISYNYVTSAWRRILN